MKQRNKNFNPIYHSISQIKNCVDFELNEKECFAGIVICFNGQEFFTSTDWRLTSVDGVEAVWPFAIRPQYPTVIECLAGVQYYVSRGERISLTSRYVMRGEFFVIPDAPGVKKKATVIIDGEEYKFDANQKLLIPIKPNSMFIATDCSVSVMETEDTRIFTVITDENTVYGHFDENRKASLI